MAKKERQNSFWNSEHASFSKFAIVATIVFAVYVFFVSSGSVLRWIRANRELRQQEEKIDSLTRDIRQLKEEIELLNSDRDSLEKFAREKLHFSAPGEDVYVLE